jgi:type IV pilus assembly protein PilE
MSKYKGFTLIELLTSLVIVSILAAIAVPSYQRYVLKAANSAAQQEMLKLAEQLERHKSRNFSYTGFDPSYLYKDKDGNLLVAYDPANAKLSFPITASGSDVQYTIYLRNISDSTKLLSDTSIASSQWTMLAVANSKVNNGSSCATCNSLQDKNYNLLLTSTGIRCKTQDKLIQSMLAERLATTTPCGANYEDW